MTKLPIKQGLCGKTVRLKGETAVLEHYAASPSAPERVMVRLDGIITIVPVSCIEVVR